MKRTALKTLICLTSLLAASAAAQMQAVPAYKPAQQISGTIRIWGSPQLSDLLHLYEAGFRKQHPAVQFVEDLKSTLTAVAGVYTDRADIGLLGREIWPTEEQAFTSIKGHTPLLIDIATGSYDVPKATFALMICVPQANPISSLSTTQLANLFSNTSDHPIHTWGDFGLKGSWAQRPIHLYGFTVENDKSQVFSQLVFPPGERWNAMLHEFSNGAGLNGADAGELIVRAVAADPDGIGISNVHYSSPATKFLALSTPNHPAPIPAIRENVASRLYPLTRAIYMVVNAGPGQPLAPTLREFLRFVLSSQGQAAVQKEGNYLPLPPALAVHQYESLQ